MSAIDIATQRTRKPSQKAKESAQQSNVETAGLVTRAADSLRVVFQVETRKMMDDHRAVTEGLKTEHRKHAEELKTEHRKQIEELKPEYSRQIEALEAKITLRL